MPPLEGDEVKQGTGLKILTPNKLLTRLPLLLAQIKSWKQFMQIKKWNQTKIISFVSAKWNYQKGSQQCNQVIIIMEENMIVLRDRKTFYSDFNWPNNVHENLKHETEFIIFSWEWNKKRNWKILSKYKHGNNIHEHGK